jgi:hypothetical protein
VNSKIELLIQAVNDLKSNSSIAKDYIYPIAIPFLSAFIGVAAAKLTFRHQEKIKAEVTKVNALNKLIIKMGEARSSLLGLKYNYNDLSETNFIKRALDIPPIIISDYKVETNASELSFLVDDNPDYTAKEYDKTWINIPRVGMMISNYHQVYSMLIKRNELCLEVLNSISSFNVKKGMLAGAPMSYDHIEDAVGADKLVAFCDLTQLFISFLDDVLFEINDFMFNFPEQAERKIEKKLIKGYCTVLKYKTGGYEIKRTIEPDYQFIADFMGLTIEQAIKKYDFGYKRNA